MAGPSRPRQSRLTRCPNCATHSRCIIRNLGEEQVRQIEPHFQEVQAGRADVVSAQGQTGEYLMLVKTGIAMVMRGAQDRGQAPIAVVGPGRVLGVNAFFGHRNPISLIAITPMRLCKVSPAALREHGLLDVPLQRSIYDASASLIESIADWSQLLRLGTIREQLLGALVLISREFGNARFRLPKHVDLAQILGVRRETIARQLTQLEDEGAIERIDHHYCNLLSTR